MAGRTKKCDLSIEALDPDLPEVRRLIAASDAFYDGLYPPESNHLTSSEDLKSDEVIFVGCRVNRQLAASGAAVIMNDDGHYAEIKRVFVLDRHRGQGLSTAIMSHLETELARRGICRVRLETGIRQPQALGLYRKLGYRERGPYGAYGPDPQSIFMEKVLDGEAQ